MEKWKVRENYSKTQVLMYALLKTTSIHPGKKGATKRGEQGGTHQEDQGTTLKDKNETERG